MQNYQGTTGSLGTWEETYRKIPAAELPWNAGMVDGDLRDLLANLKPAPGKAYDLGCGPGHDAAFLAKESWKVTAVDLSPTAVELAKVAAEKAGVKGNIRFLVSDVLILPATEDAVLVHDRGCFHTLPSETWPDYIRTVSGLLTRGGLLTLKVFSDKTPKTTGGEGPYRFTERELRNLFEIKFDWISSQESFFHGPHRPYSLFCVLQKR